MKLSAGVAKPFLKWAGGKAQLLGQIERLLPPEVKEGKIVRYVEPFIGGGAVFFFIAQTYPLREFVLFDQNEELVLAYKSVQQAVEEVIARLQRLEKEYHTLSQQQQEDYFYQQRAAFNQERPSINYHVVDERAVHRTAQLIFLNRTCFNGLFRVNGKGAFNVPFGRYHNPTICHAENLRAAAALLQRATMQHGDFAACRPVVDGQTFVYFDPPYRPISKSARFTAYARQSFDDDTQRRLAAFYRELHGRGPKLMLSNSDPHNADPTDNFFHELYRGFQINRVQAARAINRDGTRRGKISELIITNY